ncbi:hypothetical protein EQV77_03195 [Halobacillus fulvus]|nr:hypothetical protein EQV77_03195 [Halobacillus fulvus]
MELILLILFLFIVIQRLMELVVARSNRKWMLQRGAIEYGEGHYALFIVLHVSFFVSILLESFSITYPYVPLFWPAFIVFAGLQVLRIWCMTTLGRRWNTRILVLPDEKPVQKGLYKYISHPNYVIVFFELIVIPVMFQAYVTALVFPALHLLVLRVRIPVEEKALLKS